MAAPPRLLDSNPREEDHDPALRPQRLEEFVGQEAARANLRVFIESARSRGAAMDHVLFHGPPGLGKTTLAQIMSRELGVNFRMTSGPVIAKAGDLAAILTNLEARDVRGEGGFQPLDGHDLHVRQYPLLRVFLRGSGEK